MGYRVMKFQETPNPNALKCVLDGRISERPRSYFNAEEAARDDVASKLFAVPGVTNILINGDWVTVSKRTDADWVPIKREVERVLRDAD
jgi:hypothetical protein